MKKTFISILVALCVSIIIIAVPFIVIKISSNDVPYPSTESYATKAEFDAALKKCQKESEDEICYGFIVEDMLTVDCGLRAWRSKGGWRKADFRFVSYYNSYNYDDATQKYEIEIDAYKYEMGFFSESYEQIKELMVDGIQCSLYLSEIEGYALRFEISRIFYQISIRNYTSEEMVLAQYNEILSTRYILY